MIMKVICRGTSNKALYKGIDNQTGAGTFIKKLIEGSVNKSKFLLLVTKYIGQHEIDTFRDEYKSKPEVLKKTPSPLIRSFMASVSTTSRVDSNAGRSWYRPCKFKGQKIPK